MTPTYYVQHPDGSYSVADPQPQQDAQAVPLTEKQRVYLAQAWAMLEDYAADQRQAGNDSIADGADASAHEIKLMLIAAPTPPAKQDAKAVAQGFDWSKFPGHLIDHYEGEVLTEELLQRAAADLCAAPTPPAQRVMLTDDEIEDLARGKSGHSDFARAVIEAYERKNGIR